MSSHKDSFSYIFILFFLKIQTHISILKRERYGLVYMNYIVCTSYNYNNYYDYTYLQFIYFIAIKYSNVQTSVCVLSHVQLFAASWTVACQAPLSVEFSRQEYQKGLPFPPPEDLPDQGIKPTSAASPALAGGFFTLSYLGSPYIPQLIYHFYFRWIFGLFSV